MSDINEKNLNLSEKSSPKSNIASSQDMKVEQE